MSSTVGRIRATRERQVIESLGKVIEPLSQEMLNNIAVIQVYTLCFYFV